MCKNIFYTTQSVYIVKRIIRLLHTECHEYFVSGVPMSFDFQVNLIRLKKIIFLDLSSIKLKPYVLTRPEISSRTHTHIKNLIYFPLHLPLGTRKIMNQ